MTARLSLAIVADDLYGDHRGGSGKVIAAHVIDSARQEETVRVFSSIEKAQAWVSTLPDEGGVVFVPLIVDDPEYGDRKVS